MWISRISQKPLFRGMVMYSITWPVSSFIQQSFESNQYDYNRIIRFCLYGTFFVAPTLSAWMTFACKLWPKNNLKSAVIKACVEQVTYGPFAIICFLYGMTVLDGAGHDEAKREISKKFFSTWKIGAVIWPVVQTVNYEFIPERNRVPFISVCSLSWTIFLAFVKYEPKKSSSEVST